MTDTNKDREAFESEMKSAGLCHLFKPFAGKGSLYRNNSTELAWRAYQAATAHSADKINNLEIMLSAQRKDHAIDYDKLRDLMIKKFVRFNDEDCWIYQGDGDDLLESLVCPVVIDAARLIEFENAEKQLTKATATIAVKDEALQLSINRLKDMLEGDDGQAWKEARKALPQIEKARDMSPGQGQGQAKTQDEAEAETQAEIEASEKEDALNMAEQQFLGFSAGSQGESIENLTNAMGLHSDEWESLKQGGLLQLSEFEIEAVDEYFLNEET